MVSLIEIQHLTETFIVFFCQKIDFLGKSQMFEKKILRRRIRIAELIANKIATVRLLRLSRVFLIFRKLAIINTPLLHQTLYVFILERVEFSKKAGQCVGRQIYLVTNPAAICRDNIN